MNREEPANLWSQIEHDLGWKDHNMKRNRPHSGQYHQYTGVRGQTEVKGITYRDLRDCYIRAFFLASVHLNQEYYDEACKGENACLCENDLYSLDLNKLDIMAVFQNLANEVEKLIGIYPNVPDYR